MKKARILFGVVLLSTILCSVSYRIQTQTQKHLKTQWLHLGVHRRIVRQDMKLALFRFSKGFVSVVALSLQTSIFRRLAFKLAMKQVMLIN
ncbi:MAG: hypothetical protein RBR10_06910 [Bacteroidales bacterium]|jgi:hypothetical protein|nr:hypothetical protein [Bacteroidales bacterium]MDY0369558.1 hypothetical protein [Bacteroidales bacterium]